MKSQYSETQGVYQSNIMYKRLIIDHRMTMRMNVIRFLSYDIYISKSNYYCWKKESIFLVEQLSFIIKT